MKAVVASVSIWASLALLGPAVAEPAVVAAAPSAPIDAAAGSQTSSPAGVAAESTGSAAPGSATPGSAGAAAGTIPAPPAAELNAADKPEAAKPAPLPVPTLKVAINLSKQRLTVTENGKVKYAWPISSGRSGYRTPTGVYRPQWAAKMWYSKKYDDAPMPHAVFFHKGFAIHATYATGRLGSPASHGCIRLAPANAATFYKLVHKHGYARTRIAIQGTAKDRSPAVAKSNPGKRSVQSGYAKWGYSGANPKAPRYGYADPRYGYPSKPYLGSGGFGSFFD